MSLFSNHTMIRRQQLYCMPVYTRIKARMTNAFVREITVSGRLHMNTIVPAWRENLFLIQIIMDKVGWSYFNVEGIVRFQTQQINLCCPICILS